MTTAQAARLDRLAADYATMTGTYTAHLLPGGDVKITEREGRRVLAVTLMAPDGNYRNL